MLFYIILHTVVVHTFMIIILLIVSALSYTQQQSYTLNTPDRQNKRLFSFYDCYY